MAKILVWHLPKLLSASQVDQMNMTILPLRPILDKSLPHPSPGNNIPWQAQGFLDPSEAPILGAGKVTISPGYFMQSHEVRGYVTLGLTKIDSKNSQATCRPLGDLGHK
ncbi:hypothetical protein PAXRUDRAFT_20556 [Paxillus rubicundulus Ve08.2h10]|uniref:Uncharacterized protein n=1 Tax=Paxillus rubicundulus Ve08.2h10 TaxID=930991 RepID=A0A0D0CDT0_9AGAM|nr:hypothetical protein PAXRUDRAFT_20556 [Paxillus rubicundulus Ve08.2h10]